MVLIFLGFLIDSKEGGERTVSTENKKRKRSGSKGKKKAKGEDKTEKKKAEKEDKTDNLI